MTELTRQIAAAQSRCVRLHESAALKMTLVLNEIHGMGLDQPPLLIAAADRRISKVDGSYHSTRLKLFPLKSFGGAISYFGLAAFPRGSTQTFLSDWLPAFARRSPATSLAEFAAGLKLGLEAAIPKGILRKQPSGFHICGFDQQGRPDFWFLSNIGAMNGLEYTDLRDAYLEPSSHFLGRDAPQFGLDPATGRAAVGRVQFYRNGDFRVLAVASEALDAALGTLRQFPDFRLPRTPAEYGQYVKFKFEVVAYVYKKWAKKQVVARPIDVLVLRPYDRAV